MQNKIHEKIKIESFLFYKALCADSEGKLFSIMNTIHYHNKLLFNGPTTKWGLFTD